MQQRASDSRCFAFEHRGKTLLVAGLLFLTLAGVPWVNMPYGSLDWTAFGQPYETSTPTATVTLTPTVAATPTTPTPVEFDIGVDPSEPTTEDNVGITLSGMWPNACVPEYKEHQIDGFNISIFGEGGPETGSACAEVLTPWSFTVDFPPLEAGTYTVQAQVSSADRSIIAEKVVTFEVVQAAPPPPTGTDKLTARVFIDHRCNLAFDSDDIPLPNVPVTLSFPDGTSVTLQTTSFGMVYFAGIDASNGATASVDVPESLGRRLLSSCPRSPTTIELRPSDFEPGQIAHKHVQFRVYTSGISSAE